MRRCRTVLLAALAACSGDPAGPVEAYVIVPDASGAPSVQRRPLPVRDARTLANDVFAFEARSNVHFNPDGTGEVSEAKPVELKLVTTDGAWAAADHTSLVSLSVAHHLFAAREHFVALGLPAALPPARVILLPNAIEGLASPEDNAFFAPGFQAFLVLRENVFDQVPFGTNLGIMVHEFAHYAFTHRLRENGQDALWSRLRPIDEGLADVHGAAVTKDSFFVAHSAPDDRDLAAERTYAPGDESNFSPYVYGAILASTFWDYRRRLIDGGIAEPDATRRMSQIAYDGAGATVDLDADTLFEDTFAPYDGPFFAAFAASARRLGERDGAVFCAAVRRHFAARKTAIEKACP